MFIVELLTPEGAKVRKGTQAPKRRQGAAFFPGACTVYMAPVRGLYEACTKPVHGLYGASTRNIFILKCS